MPTSNTSKYRQFAQRVGLSGVASVVVNLRNVILLPFLTKGMSIEIYAAWLNTLGLVELGTHLTTLSLPAAMTRFCGSFADRSTAAVGLWSAMIFCSGAGAVLAMAMWLADDFLSASLLYSDENGDLIRIAALLIPVSACERLLLSFFQARLQMVRHSTIVVFEAFAYIGLAIFLITSGYGAEEILLSMLGVRSLILLAAIEFARRDVSFAAPSPVRLQQYLAFSLPLAMVGVFTWITGLSDRYIVGFFHGPVMVSGYGVAYTLAMTCTLLFAPAFMILTPTLVSLWEAKEMDSLRGHLRHTVRYALALTIPAVVGLTVLAEPLVELISTSGYYIGQATIGIIAAGLLLWMLAAVSETVIGIRKQTRSIAMIYGGATLINVGLNFALIPHFLTLGAAFATFASYLFMLFSMDRKARRLGLGVPLDWLFILKCLLASAVMALAASYPEVKNLLDLSVTIVASVGTYCLLLILLRTFSKAEFSFWRGLFFGRIGRNQPS
jgi:O-antigen/teichoic acid export membrane protein